MLLGYFAHDIRLPPRQSDRCRRAIGAAADVTGGLSPRMVRRKL